MIAIIGNVSWANSYDDCLKQLAPKYPTMADALCRDCEVLAELGLPCDSNRFDKKTSKPDVFGGNLDLNYNNISIPKSPCGISNFCGPGPIFYWNGHMKLQNK
jgi:hypothetical protein